ncbi:MAG: hypothetical protein ACOX10_02005 [Candidatus Methanomethylophilaceae archaeon]
MEETHTIADAMRSDLVEKAVAYQIAENGNPVRTLARVSFSYCAQLGPDTCGRLEALMHDMMAEARRIILQGSAI